MILRTQAARAALNVPNSQSALISSSMIQNLGMEKSPQGRDFGLWFFLIFLRQCECASIRWPQG